MALIASTAFAQTERTATVNHVFFEDHFNVPMPQFTAPDWGCDAPVPTTNGWLLANARPDFQANNDDKVQVAGGLLRCWSTNNSGLGGYLAYYHPIPQMPTSWRLTVKLKNELDTPSRAVPEVLVNSGPNPIDPCNPFPLDDPAGKLGFQRHDMGTELVLRDGVSASYPILTGYDVLGNGSFHIIELTSTPHGSELRAWPAGGDRPVLPQAVGQSLGPARRVHFGGPNLMNYDYSMDYVRLEEVVELDPIPVEETLLLAESFGQGTPIHTAPAWACDLPLPTTRGWLLGNIRPDFPAASPSFAEVSSGRLHVWSTSNSASGGYLAYHKLVPQRPNNWRLITRLKVDLAFADRPVPSVFVQVEPATGEPCSLFPNDLGVRGFQADAGQELILRDGVTYPIHTGYPLPANGSFHTIELISTPLGSELRAWPDAGQRPAFPLAVGASLGVAPKVLFAGPNFRNFDYSVDYVRLYARL